MSDDVTWVPFEDTIRERLRFDLDAIRGITNHMPRDLAEGYEASVTVALGGEIGFFDADALLTGIERVGLWQSDPVLRGLREEIEAEETRQ